MTPRPWVPVATGMTELRHGHDAPPLGSRLRGNDGLGEGTTDWGRERRRGKGMTVGRMVI